MNLYYYNVKIRSGHVEKKKRSGHVEKKKREREKRTRT